MVDTAWVALSLTERVGGKTLRALMNHFHHDPKAVLAADSETLQAVPGIGPKIARNIQEIDLLQLEQTIPVWEQAGVRVITIHHLEYPPRLRQLGDDAPPTLFVRGDVWRPFMKSIAIVGRRHPSEEAQKTARSLGFCLAERDYVVVSGLAYGIDYAAHSSALSVSTGYTAAVLGSGVLNIYPPDHEEGAAEIMRRGALVSELHPERAVSSSNLVARNRIISGLSDSLIVVESEADGGAMYAARFAKAQGRQVYVVDFPASGNRALIEAGAWVIRPDLRDLPFDS
jgi:DNA processing protein